MCDLAGGGVLVGHPVAGPAAEIAYSTLERVAERYGGRRRTSLAERLDQPAPPVWSEGERPREEQAVAQRPREEQAVALPFDVDLVEVPEGSELSFVDEIRSEYLEAVLHHEELLTLLAGSPELRLSAAANWTFVPSSGVMDPVDEPFAFGPHHDFYRNQLGLHQAWYPQAENILVAVLDNGFDGSLLPQDALVETVDPGMDVIAGDAGTSGHGTLVASLVAAAAPGVRVTPIRMAGERTTEFDTLHALCRAVGLRASVITLSYTQDLRGDFSCGECGVTRRTARSEVFEKLLGWAADGGRRAVLAASGNTAMPEVARPASYPGAMPVTALDTSMRALAPFSSWDGSGQHQLLATPGQDVAMGRVTQRSFSGTSFAVAYAAAVVAVMLARIGVQDARLATSILRDYGYVVDSTVVPVMP
jgi:hypothetical protein